MFLRCEVEIPVGYVAEIDGPESVQAAREAGGFGFIQASGGVETMRAGILREGCADDF